MNREDILKMEAGRKMDQIIWWKIFNMKPTPEYNDMLKLPHYSTDIAAAWEVAEHLTTNSIFTTLNLRGGGGGWEAGFYAPFINSWHAAELTAPLAICRAALLAAMEKKT